ncbi:MAG: DUF1828 domain-containing protein [Roseburia sp.]|nr:DUF1828 domain-containing protein [Anaeroplasma bactoclasticum]MCM1195746.1 DUF1828 domain-containing protein [Roseburia sp.]MCM1557667.1 DUF1828 domain-containing protein [Anaeroplasma bactoclasticum]
MDYQEFKDGYYKMVKITEQKDSFIIALPTFHPFTSDCLQICFITLSDGRVKLTDCGTTLEYLEEVYITLSSYKAKVDCILKRFGCKFEDGLLVCELSTGSASQVRSLVGNFIEAIALIANIDI